MIPVYNEERTVATTVRRVLALDAVLREIVIVDDGSTDDTAKVLQQLAQEDQRIRVYQLPRNCGKTAAIAQAIHHAQGDILIVQDADLEYDPAEIPAVIEPILEGQADVVYGSRFLVRRTARVLYFYNYLANCFLTFLSNLLTNRNMTDIETCYKAFRREVIKPMQLTSRGFGMEVEITAMICKTIARTYEVPISYYGRTVEEGKKIGFRDGVAALWYIFKYNLFARRRRYVLEVNQQLEKRHALQQAALELIH
jgi:glycosyltransferase involved in cell wall biosynthesis